MTAKELEEGRKAPRFSLGSADGGTVTLDGLRGGWVAMFFYPKASTSGCTKEAIAFQQAKGKFTRMGAKILGVSRDSAKANGKFAEKEGLKFPLLCDPDKAVHESYGVMKEKKMYGKTVMGVDRSTFLIDPEGTIRKMWRSVKVPGHVDEVYDALKALRAEDRKKG